VLLLPKREQDDHVPRFPKRYSHFVYGVIQSGLTSAIAGAIACLPFFSEGSFFSHWIASWLISWATMLPVVLLAASFIRKLTDALCRQENTT
jgi:ABC-type Fe3+-siderophore transport system permease subunit